MGLIAEQQTSKARRTLKEKVRTGQATLMGYTPDGTPYYDTPPNGNGGGCAPVPATQAQTWGAACPTGDCPPDQLASSLGRRFADQGPCRELPYWIRLTADANGDIDAEFSSLVTMCPTRIEVVEQTPLAGSRLEELEFGNQNQMAGDPLFLSLFAPGSYAAIPWVPDCVRSGFPVRIVMSGLTPDEFVWFAFVGPMSG